MKIKFLASFPGLRDLTEILFDLSTISATRIPPNSDISPLPEGFKDLHIAELYTDSEGEIYVSLSQHINPMYSCVPVDGLSHNWEESEWIDFADAQEDKCYCIPTTAPKGYEIIWDETAGWTVTLPQPAEETGYDPE